MDQIMAPVAIEYEGLICLASKVPGIFAVSSDRHCGLTEQMMYVMKKQHKAMESTRQPHLNFGSHNWYRSRPEHLLASLEVERWHYH
jgi:hypothetical protein